MSRRNTIKWLAEPEDHDYPAAASYLTLLYPEPKVGQVIERLKRAPIVQFKSKDIFRASQLPVLPGTNSHVKKDIKRIQQGKDLSPVLLVRDEVRGKVVIADGYHRLCAVYEFDEDAWIDCKIV